MKLFVQKNNPETLKVLLAARISQKQLDISFVELNEVPDKLPRRIPCLLLNSGTSVFSSNAITKYLLPHENTDTVDYWLDIEAVVLQPLIVNLSPKGDDLAKNSFESVLQSLNSALNGSKYLTKNQISAADICLFSTLYSIYLDAALNKDLLQNKEHILRWLNEIQKLPAAEEAIKDTKLTPTATGTLSGSHWFPPPVLRGSKIGGKEPAKGSDSPNAQESPSHESVAVSEEECKQAKEYWLRGAKERKSLKAETVPVLPIAGERNVLISSALPYVNNVPHLGNIIGCVLSGDVFARYCRLRGYNTLYVCGTDEYGTATETKALEEGLTPQQICDKYYKIHEAVYKWFNIKFDIFGRTTTPEQTRICQEIFLKVKENGFIASDTVEQLLCEKCDRFLADRFVEGICPFCSYEDARGDQCDGCGHLINATELKQPRCKLCQATPVIRLSTQFFLDLPKIEPKLKIYLESVYNNWSNNAKVITRSWLRDGLKQRCITRDLKWGIPVPLDGFRDKVFYVWFDAPIGYISITNRYTDQWKKWWLPEKKTKVEYFNFVGKDNVPFHAVMFPATLLSTQQNYTVVQYIYATEYLNYEDGKFSKSRGVGVFGTDAQDTGIPADVWRFYLLYLRPESQDSNFSWLDLATKNNSELLNNLGNFINRALMFADKNFKGQIPEMELIDEDYSSVALINRELTNYLTALEKGRLRDGIRHILSISRIGNQIMQASQPWVLLKGTDEEKKRAGTIIGFCCNISCLLSILLYPYMPQTAECLKKQMNIPVDVITIENTFSILLKPGHKLGKPSPLFNKIEISHIEKLKTQFSGRQRSKTPDGGDIPPKTNPLANLSVAELEKAILDQGDVVRKLKASGKEKSEWQPQVTILLDLKKQLTVAQANAKESQKPEKEISKTPPKEIKKESGQVNGIPEPSSSAQMEKKPRNQGSSKKGKQKK